MQNLGAEQGLHSTKGEIERGLDGEVEGVEEEGGVHGIGNREALGNCVDSGVRWPWECRPGWNGYRVRRKVQTWSWSRQPWKRFARKRS